MYREYLPEHLKPEMGRAGVERCVFVQANHQLGENEWVLDLIDQIP
jgi:predicted TIM-barrel fold metal-dependent hydrolase